MDHIVLNPDRYCKECAYPIVLEIQITDNGLLILYLLIGYLIGSIPFSQIIAFYRKGVDLRSAGYHSVGAYNVINTVDFKWGVLAGSLDAFKGVATLTIVSLLGCTYPICIWAGLAAVVGHNHPIWLGFKGGRGVSVAIGLMIGIIPLETIIGIIASLLAFYWIRRVNRSVAIGFIVVIVLTILRGSFSRIQLLLIGEIIVICASYIPRAIRMMLGTSWYLEEIKRRKNR